MKVLVTGATGFTGSYTVQVLLKNGIRVRCLVRNTSDISCFHDDKIEIAYGDFDDPGSVRTALDGVDALVNIASIGFGHAPGIVKAVVDAGIKRAVFISTTAIYTKLNAASKTVRIAAEECIKSSGLGYTIIRPTMIYGSSKDRNIYRLIRFVKNYPVIPVFGNGNYLVQPIYVQDLADAIVKALISDATQGREYNVAGAEPLTFNQLIETVSLVLDKNIRMIHFSSEMIVNVLSLFEKFRIKLPIKSEQVLRLNENKDFDYSDATQDFGFSPISFFEGVGYEIAGIAH